MENQEIKKPSLHAVIRIFTTWGFDLAMAKALAQGIRGEEMTSTKSGNKEAAEVLERYEKMAQDNILDRTAKALLKVFESFIDGTKEEKLTLIREHLHTGADDPGGWSRGAAVIIHSESIPLPCPAEVPAIELWCRVSDELGDYYVEHINYGVAAIYPVG